MAAFVDELSSFVQCCVGFCSGDEVFFEPSIAGWHCLSPCWHGFAWQTKPHVTVGSFPASLQDHHTWKVRWR